MPHWDRERDRDRDLQKAFNGPADRFHRVEVRRRKVLVLVLQRGAVFKSYIYIYIYIYT